MSGAIAAWLTAPIVPLAWAWKIARSDGMVLGFTSHDRDLVRGGMTYVATPGIAPSALSLSASLDADTMDIAGALTADAISEDDLDAGRWDGAAVTLHIVNWEDADEPMILVAQGSLGAVERKRGAFAAELRTLDAGLDAPVAPETAPGCRARLGDSACRVDLAPRTRLVRLAGVEGRMVTVESAGDGAINGAAFAYGRLRFVTGPNAGLTGLIVAGAGQSLTLARDPVFPVDAGTRAEIIEGCDKQLATCAARFGNAVNFRGEPYLPGMDYVTRYPGA
ncbi:hypothetical protein DMP17_08535 [Pseudonocardia sp. TMWB2A]|uniref:DUF2163 domain-containing protein n=1 Tax=Pseudonocardia sp. TMWB2A TaxID=687430 RepID=UPI00307CF390